MHTTVVRVLGRVKRTEVPKPEHLGGKRQAEGGVFQPVIDELMELKRGEAVVVEHNSPSAQYFHARIHLACRDNNKFLYKKIVVRVRGAKAYIWLKE